MRCTERVRRGEVRWGDPQFISGTVADSATTEKTFRQGALIWQYAFFDQHWNELGKRGEEG